MAHAVTLQSTTRTANRHRSGEVKILAAIEADLEKARRSGSIEDVFLALEEIYAVHMHTEDRDVRARCELILRGSAARA